VTPAAHHAWLALLLIGAGVWLGGYVAIPVVVLAARRSLAPAERVAFFRALGRAYLPVGGGALALALLSGGVLLFDRPRDATTVALAALAAALVALLAVAVAQARRMTRLRAAAAATPNDAGLAARAAAGGRLAAALRALLGVITLVLFVLGAGLGA